MYTTRRHHAKALSISHGVQAVMRGRAECNALKTVGRGYPERQATTQDVMLNKHAHQVFKTGWIFRTALTTMLEMCIYRCAGGVCKVTMYFKCKEAISSNCPPPPPGIFG